MISITIKDKPIADNQCQELITQQLKIHFLKSVFGALLKNAQLERQVRKFRIILRDKRKRRRVEKCFRAWRMYLTEVRAKFTLQNCVVENEVTNDNESKFQIASTLLPKYFLGECQEPEVYQSHIRSSSKNNSIVQNIRFKFNNRSKKSEQVLETPLQSRLKAQKQIIEEQRLKLIEQTKIIEKLKLEELRKRTKQTSKQTVAVAKEAIGNCNKQTRRNISKLLREEGYREEIVKELCPPALVPKFGVRIEERIKHRRQRMKEIGEERNRKLAEQKRKREEMRILLEEEKRQQYLSELKEATKERQEQQARRKKEMDREKHWNYLVNLHYNRYLFRWYFLRPFKYFVTITRDRENVASNFYQLTLSRKIMAAWITVWQEQRTYKIRIAIKFHHHTLMWNSFATWKKFYFELKYKYQIALNFYRKKSLTKLWKTWHSKYLKHKSVIAKKEYCAIEHYNSRLKLSYFFLWKKYVLLIDDIREKDRRRDAWRNLITKVSYQNNNTF